MTTKISGVYRITNTAKGLSYIGSSKDIDRRWVQHRSKLRYNKHKNPKLQAAWNKYGEAVFACEVIEFLPEGKLQERETYWINATWPFNYNILRGAGQAWLDRKPPRTKSGWHHTPESRSRISASHLGKKHRPYTEEEKAAQSLRLKGKPKTEEHRRNIADAKKGIDVLSPEARKRQAQALSQSERGENNPNFGNRWNEEQRQRMSETLATLRYDVTCGRCGREFKGVTRSSYGGHRRKCLATHPLSS